MGKGERYAKRPEGALSPVDASERYAKRLKRLQAAVARKSGRGVHAAATEVVRSEADHAVAEECARLLATAMMRAEMFLIFNEASTRLARFWRFCAPTRTFHLVQKYRDEGPTIERVKSIRFLSICSSTCKHVGERFRL